MLQLESSRHDGVCRITLRGELDLATASRVEEELGTAERDRPERIVLDLGRLEFMDATGIHLLLRLRERLGRDRLSVLRPAGPAARVIELAGVERHVGFD